MSPVHRVWPNPSCKAQWRGKKTRQTEEEVGSQNWGNGQVWGSPSPRGQRRTEKMEKTGFEIICGAPTTLAVKGLRRRRRMMMMMMMMMNYFQQADSSTIWFWREGNHKYQTYLNPSELILSLRWTFRASIRRKFAISLTTTIATSTTTTETAATNTVSLHHFLSTCDFFFFFFPLVNDWLVYWLILALKRVILQQWYSHAMRTDMHRP